MSVRAAGTVKLFCWKEGIIFLNYVHIVNPFSWNMNYSLTNGTPIIFSRTITFFAVCFWLLKRFQFQKFPNIVPVWRSQGRKACPKPALVVRHLLRKFHLTLNCSQLYFVVDGQTKNFNPLIFLELHIFLQFFQKSGMTHTIDRFRNIYARDIDYTILIDCFCPII